ncbi:MAG: helix-turn-helix domain-containing protein [Gammaproteobacteria bacterium]|nr:helix-turn-helix domain-containing protein [Gammaproteobacteria bacterium]
MRSTARSTVIHIGLLSYPGVMRSSVQGLTELFQLANRICAQYPQANLARFAVSDWRPQHGRIKKLTASSAAMPPTSSPLTVAIVPPSLGSDYYEQPDQMVMDWLVRLHRQGTLVCSICAGAFILAAAGLLEQRQATTHWNLSARFQNRFPRVLVDTDRALINDGDIITAGGLMSWMDLGLELVEQFTRPAIMFELGKLLIVDTGKRQQRYYKRFLPPFDHGNDIAIKAQHYIQKNYRNVLGIKKLARYCNTGERTLLRHFVAATGYKPADYIQNLRIQKARELIETTRQAIERIAFNVGYNDVSAFRKIFKKLTGLSPKEFRARFVA